MYTLAGYLAETIGHASWEDLVQENLLNPMGMTDSGFVDQLGDFDNFALPYVLKNGKLVPIDKELVK